MIIPINKLLSFIESPRNYLYAHCLLIEDEQNVLIDSSCATKDILILQDKKIDIILHTHFHEDHILGNPAFPLAKIWAHEADAPAIRSLDTFMDFYAFKALGEEAEIIGKNFIASIELQASAVDHEFNDGDIFNFGKSTWQIIHTPGHTPGHSCFYWEKEGILFSGDIDLSSFGPWYGHMCSNIDDFISSIDKCIEISPQMLISSHKGIFTEDIKSKLINYKNMIFITEEAVLKALQEKPQTLEHLAAQYLYYGPSAKEKADDFLLVFEKMGLLLQLERLIRLKQIEKTDDLYFLL